MRDYHFFKESSLKKEYTLFFVVWVIVINSSSICSPVTLLVVLIAELLTFTYLKLEVMIQFMPVREELKLLVFALCQLFLSAYFQYQTQIDVFVTLNLVLGHFSIPMIQLLVADFSQLQVQNQLKLFIEFYSQFLHCYFKLLLV